ncbi:ommochrome-binding protein [Bombyx mori]|uniref:Ommochrome-binding protein-like n=1 Tax=Bombyx mori TaxID=7091 RepID=A0A8R1WGK6_BOMMO|nr:ommochrome-binding protein [Bombyx mori]
MKLIILITIIAFVHGNQEVEVLKDNVHNASQLVVDYQTNTLFFSHSSLFEGKTVLKSAYLNLNTKEFGEISGINSGVATAYDRSKNVVYLGGQDGIYKFNHATKSAKNLRITNYSIRQMFHSPTHGLFFTTFNPEEKAFVYSYGQVGDIVPELTDIKTSLIADSKKYNIYFANSAGIFVLTNINGVLFKVHLHVIPVNGFASDFDDRLYFSTPNAIFFINENGGILEEVFRVEESETILGLAFTADGNMIYALDDKIMMKKK